MKPLVLVLFLVACSGPKSKPESPLVKEGSAVSESCCCKHTPATSDEGKPVFDAATNRMDCSQKQGSCVDEVQCKQGDEPPTM